MAASEKKKRGSSVPIRQNTMPGTKSGALLPKGSWSPIAGTELRRGQQVAGARSAVVAAAAAKAAAAKAAAAKKKPVSKPVPLGGVKQGSVPAKNTGGAEKKSWGGWSVPKKVTPLKKTAGGVARRQSQGRKVK